MKVLSTFDIPPGSWLTNGTGVPLGTTRFVCSFRDNNNNGSTGPTVREGDLDLIKDKPEKNTKIVKPRTARVVRYRKPPPPPPHVPSERSTHVRTHESKKKEAGTGTDGCFGGSLFRSNHILHTSRHWHYPSKSQFLLRQFSLVPCANDGRFDVRKMIIKRGR